MRALRYDRRDSKKGSGDPRGVAVVVDTGWAMGGVCAEIGCLAAEKWFHDLKAPVHRVGLPDVPTPAGYTLEQFYYPDAQKIAGVVREMVKK